MIRLKHLFRTVKCLLIIITITACNSSTEPNEHSQQVSFTRSTHAFTPSATFQIELGDVDGDGDLDAAFANMGNNNSQVWFNDGSGNFTNSGQSHTQQGHGIGLEDLDGDNDLDLFISCASFGSADNLSHKPSKIYFNNGSGTFIDSGQDLGDTEESGNGINLIDIDGDGDFDAHIAYYALDRTGFYHKIYLNDGQGQFTETNIPFPFDSELGWGDIDNDGDVDVFLRQRGANYKTLLNDGSGNFTERWSIANTNILYGSSAFGDFDNDGDFDVITSNADNDISYPTTLFLNDGTGMLADSGQQLNVTKWARIKTADFNIDGFLDVFVPNFQLPNEVWINDGTGNLEDSGLRLSGNAGTPSCAIGDLDGDGDLDVFVANFENGSNEIWINNFR